MGEVIVVTFLDAIATADVLIKKQYNEISVNLSILELYIWHE